MKKTLGILAVGLLAAVMVRAAPNYERDEGTVEWTNTSAAVTAGQLVDLGDRYGVALVDIASNGTGTVQTHGVWKFNRAITNAVAWGAVMYYSTADQVTTVAAADKYVGIAVEAADICTSLVNSLGETNKFIAVEINPPQRQCIINLDLMPYSTQLVVLARNDGAGLTNTPITVTVTKQTGEVTATNYLVTPTAAVTIQSTAAYDSTGAAITNAAGAAILFATNATVAITPPLASNAVVTVLGGGAVMTNATATATNP